MGACDDAGLHRGATQSVQQHRKTVACQEKVGQSHAVLATLVLSCNSARNANITHCISCCVRSPRTAVGCWVAVKQIHNLIGNEGVPHWIGMALKTVGKGSETGRYLVHFTGIGWHGQNRPVVNTSMIKLKEARDTEEEPFIILQADPLAKRKLPV